MIYEKLMRVQTELKAPKNLFNSFGKYKYRNAEGICEAVKPFLKKEGLALTLSDEMVEVGGRVYLKATATLLDLTADSGQVNKLSVTAFAREAEKKAGMDDSQITGTASSYARKYALNGLFLLDDTKDADTDEYKVQAEEKAKVENTENSVISEVKIKALLSRCSNEGVDPAKIKELYKVTSFADLTEKQYANINQFWKKIKGE